MTRLSLMLVPALALALLGACKGPTEGDRSRAGSSASCCVSNAPPSAVLPAFTDRSLYQLESPWTDDAGKTLRLGELKGRVQVVALFFTHCTYACPIIVHDMRRIEEALPETLRTKVGFTLITMDVERDTPEVLRAYRQTRRLPDDRWRLLRGTEEDTLELAALLGVKFKREISGQFAHSNLITVLNSEGEIIHQLVGLNQDVQDTVKHVMSSVAGPPL